MKNLILLSFLFAVSLGAIGQTKLQETDIVGTWNVTAVELGEGLYVNLENDSVHVADSIRKDWKSTEDSVVAVSMLKMLAMAMKQFVITIHPKGVFEAHMGPKGDTGTYVITGSQVVLNMKDKGDPLVGTRQNGLMTFESGQGSNRLLMYFRKQ